VRRSKHCQCENENDSESQRSNGEMYIRRINHVSRVCIESHEQYIQRMWNPETKGIQENHDVTRLYRMYHETKVHNEMTPTSNEDEEGNTLQDEEQVRNQ
jgi:hypothetical protein